MNIFTIFDKTCQVLTRQFMEVGEYIRNLRKSKDLLLRELAGNLSMDQAILSKIERGERKATKEQIIAVSEYFSIKNDELKILWLSEIGRASCRERV